MATQVQVQVKKRPRPVPEPDAPPATKKIIKLWFG